MPVQVKCPYCEQRDDKENMIQVGARYWHEQCIEDKESNKSEEELIKERDNNERRELIGYICNLFNMKRPNGYILQQIKSFHEEYEYRYYAMQLALEYFFVIKNNPIGDRKTIGIIPYVMEDTIKFYTELSKVDQQQIKETKKILTKIRPPQNKRDRRKKMINIDDI